jgi:hypothetical protein
MVTHFDNLENLKNHYHNTNSSVIFDKVSKKKALISDVDDG